MLTLALDTSTTTVSVALLEEERIYQERLVQVRDHHSATLLPLIDEVLRVAGIKVCDLDLIACTIGPGSFTGLRIGVCTAKGLALATQKPVVGISTLEALALNIAHSSRMICTMLDARRDQVYAALYRGSDSLLPERIGEETVVKPVDYLNKVKGDTIFVGSGALEYGEIIRKTQGKRAYFAAGHEHVIRAAAVGILGLRSFKAGVPTDAFHLNPRYLRPCEAESKL